MQRHFGRVVRYGWLPTVALVAVLVSDMPSAIKNADRNIHDILANLGVDSPPSNLASYVWQHPWSLILLWVFVFAVGALFSWGIESLLGGKRDEPSPPTVVNNYHIQNNFIEAAKSLWNKMVPISLQAETKPVASEERRLMPGPFSNPKPEVPMWPESAASTNRTTDLLAQRARRIRDNTATSEFDYPTLKAILRAAIPHPKGQRVADKGPTPHRTDVVMEITSIHDKPLHDCSIFVSSIESNGIEETKGRLALRGTQSLFEIKPKSVHNFCLVSREISDPITPDPFVLKMLGETYAFRENSTYTVRLELRSPYPYPTLVVAKIVTGEGLDVECQILGQGLPEIRDD